MYYSESKPGVCRDWESRAGLRPDRMGWPMGAADVCVCDRRIRCQHYMSWEERRGVVAYISVHCTDDHDKEEPGTTAAAGSIKPSTDGLSPGSRKRVDGTFSNSALSFTRGDSKPSDTLRERSRLRDARCNVQTDAERKAVVIA